MRKRKNRRKHNANFIVLAIFSVTFLFIGLAYANTNYQAKITGTAKIAFDEPDIETTLTLSHSIIDLGLGEKIVLVATVNPGSGTEVINWSTSLYSYWKNGS